jgi:hypothetical protein
MSDHRSFEDQASDLIEQHLQFLRGKGPEPDLRHLSASQRRAMQERLDLVDALADREPILPPLDEDPVAIRLGLVSDRVDPTTQGTAHHPPGPLATNPVRELLDELESRFDGQVYVDWSPSWAQWRTEDLEPMAQCSVLGDSLALFLSDMPIGDDEPVQLASFLRRYPGVSTVGLVSRDASRAALLTAAACARSIDPVRGWLEPGAFVVTDSLDLTLIRYFERRLPRWDRVAGIAEVLELGDITVDARQVIVEVISAELGTRPRLEHKKRAQQALRAVDPDVLSALVVEVQTGGLTGGELTERLSRLAEAAP